MYRPSQETELWSEGVSIFSPLVEKVVQSIWKLLRIGGAPIGNVLAFVLWCGLSLADLTALLLRLWRRVAKWFGASCEVPSFLSRQQQSFTTKRYYVALVCVMAMSVCSALARSIQRRLSSYWRRRDELKAHMRDAKSQREWAQHAAQLRSLDRIHGRRRSPAWEARLFNAPLIKRKAQHLRQLFENGAEKMEAAEMMRRLREDLVRKLGNMQDSAIYDYHGKIPEPIAEYLSEVQRCLNFIVASDQLSDQQKLSFFQETRHTFGRTALMLSGGGSLGTYHLVRPRPPPSVRFFMSVKAMASHGKFRRKAHSASLWVSFSRHEKT